MAEKQLTTIEQLRALAERGKQDTLIRINELLDFRLVRQAYHVTPNLSSKLCKKIIILCKMTSVIR